eukprot:1970361-Ditylum_brightwellii.AAC.1
MDYKNNPAGSQKAVQTLEKGLSFHHVPNRSVRMKKSTGKKAKTDEENVEVFADHFCKVFNNPDPPPCDKSTLPIIPTHPEFLSLGDPPSLDEVHNAIMRMHNGKAPGPSGITSDDFWAMVFCRPDPDKTGINDDADYLCDYITEILCLFWTGELDIEMWHT